MKIKLYHAREVFAAASRTLFGLLIDNCSTLHHILRTYSLSNDDNHDDDEVVYQFSSVQLSRSVVSDSLQPHGPQHARLSCLSPTPRAYSNSCPSNQETPSNHLILCCPLLLPPSIFPSLRVFSNESVHCIRWPKYWSFSFNISPSNEYSGLISFRILVGSPCSPRDSQESSPTPQFKSINSLILSFLYSPTLTSIHDYWKNHSLD